jgi:hypothetical protein
VSEEQQKLPNLLLHAIFRIDEIVVDGPNDRSPYRRDSWSSVYPDSEIRPRGRSLATSESTFTAQPQAPALPAPPPVCHSVFKRNAGRPVTGLKCHKKTGQHPQGLLAGSTRFFDGTGPTHMPYRSSAYQSRLYQSGENIKNPDTGVRTRDGRAG